MLKLMIFPLATMLTGCAVGAAPTCAKHHCDPSVDEQFKQNASWDARTRDEYMKVPAQN